MGDVWGPWFQGRQPAPPLWQVRDAYLQFMTSVALMLRKDLNLPTNGFLVRHEMAQVLQFETQLANVRWGRGQGARGLGAGPR